MSFEGSITPPESDDDCNITYHDVTSPVLKQRLSARTVGMTSKTQDKDLNEQYYECAIDFMVKHKQLHNPHILDNRTLQNYKSFLNTIQELMSNSNSQHNSVFNAVNLLFSLSTSLSVTVIEEISSFSSESIEDWLICICEVNSMLLDMLAYAIKFKCVLQSLQIFFSDGVLVEGEANCLNKTVQRVLHDIACISAYLFRTNSASNKALSENSACSVFCKLVGKCRSLLASEEYFWNMIMSLINLIVQDTNRHLHFDATSSALSFCWWWIKILPFNNNTSIVSGSVTVINSLLRRSLASCMKMPNIVSYHIRCYEEVIMLLYDQMPARQWKPAELAGFHLLWQNISQYCFLPSRVTSCRTRNLFLLSVQQWLFQPGYQLNENEINDIFMTFLTLLKNFVSKNNGYVYR